MKNLNMIILRRECSDILIDKKSWSSVTAERFHIDMLQLVDTCVQLCLSFLPDNIMRYLSWIGFSCDRDHAQRMLYLVSQEGTSFSASAAKIAICLYECVLIPVFDARTPEISKVLEITNRELEVCDQVRFASIKTS